jgi:hypothetical protein
MSLNFLYIRHLTLELNFVDQLEADVLDLAFILQAAPSMEKLEIHVSLICILCFCSVITY